jgi:hypothetical protein
MRRDGRKVNEWVVEQFLVDIFQRGRGRLSWQNAKTQSMCLIRSTEEKERQLVFFKE